jgi:alkylhydroperoxidase/carboxymuconolactone decarboxylase family protein YurZ
MEKFFEPLFVTRYKNIESELTLDSRLQTLLAISSLVSLGNHDFLKSYIEYALSETLNFEEIQEVILQCYLFAGFPSAIEGFIVLKSVQEKEFIALEKKGIENIDTWRNQGEELCKKIYANNYDKMIKNVKSLNPDLADWMIIEGYGKTLSRKGLKPVTRELCAITSLAVLKWERQLYSHCRGAMNCGANIDDINSALLIAELFKRGIYNEYKYILERIG